MSIFKDFPPPLLKGIFPIHRDSPSISPHIHSRLPGAAHKNLDSELDQLKLNTFVYIMPHIFQGEYSHNTTAINEVVDEVIEK